MTETDEARTDQTEELRSPTSPEESMKPSPSERVVKDEGAGAINEVAGDEGDKMLRQYI